MNLARDFDAERRLLDLAGEAAGYSPQRIAGQVVERNPTVVQLESFAATRAHPGGILLPPGRDLLVEGAEEIADCAGNYFLWEAVRCESGLAIGDHERTVRYDRAMRALVRQIQSWAELHRIPT